MSKGNFGIIVSGGPAPGINCAIASMVIEASNRGYRSKGFVDGFKAVTGNAADTIVDLEVNAVTPHAHSGGSILGTSRFNPFDSRQDEDKLRTALEAHQIDKVVTIGGEGSAYLSYRLGKLFPKLQVVHLPKTIDNDLVLPNNYPSFGYETACFAGTNILRILALDAKTTHRWFIVTTMGRKSGALALGLGIAGAATITLVPEEFRGLSVKPSEIAGLIFESIQLRARQGKNYGIVLLAEGVIEMLDAESTEELKNCPRDHLGRIKYAEVSLEHIIARSLRSRIAEQKLEVQISTKNIGYELRCHDPISFDIEYTRFLGYGAVDYLLSGASGGVVVRDFDKLGFIKFEDMMDQSGAMRSRPLDLNSDLYRVAKSYMIR